jgi:predicted dithiol-disulfide oxidoreductase (DUF899 family)
VIVPEDAVDIEAPRPEWNGLRRGAHQNGQHQWLDRAPKGRNETGPWWRRHDAYDKR